MEQRKRIVSLRINTSDYEKVRDIAKRLRVRESKVLRFAIKIMLAKLAPLHDPKVCGGDLLPVFADFGAELTNYFALDASRLDTILNAGVEDPEKRIQEDDIDLLAMSPMSDNYLRMKLKKLTSSNNHTDTLDVNASLRDYLLEKYIDQGQEEVEQQA